MDNHEPVGDSARAQGESSSENAQPSGIPVLLAKLLHAEIEEQVIAKSFDELDNVIEIENFVKEIKLCEAQ